MLYAASAVVLLTLALSISDTVHTVIRILGAAILLVLAVGMLVQSGNSQRRLNVAGTGAHGDAFPSLGVGLSSPFNLVFMFSVLPQFASRETLLDPSIVALFPGLFIATMGPMIVTVWVATGARAMGDRFATLLVRTGAVVLLVFAGLSIASVA